MLTPQGRKPRDIERGGSHSFLQEYAPRPKDFLPGLTSQGPWYLLSATLGTKPLHKDLRSTFTQEQHVYIYSLLPCYVGRVVSVRLCLLISAWVIRWIMTNKVPSSYW